MVEWMSGSVNSKVIFLVRVYEGVSLHLESALFAPWFGSVLDVSDSVLGITAMGPGT